MTNADLIKRLRVAVENSNVGNLNGRISARLGEEAADALEATEARLIAKLANAERRAEDAETRNDFLLSEIDKIIKRERQRK